MKKIPLLVGVLAGLLLTGCGILKQMEGVYRMTECKYSYHSLTQLTLAGVDMSKGISLAVVPKVLNILSGRETSIPLSFNLQLDVQNPNASEAFMQGVEYILSIDNVRFTSGQLNQALNIPAGGQQVLSLGIGFDLKTLLQGETRDAALTAVKNLIGLSDQKSNITIQLRPSFMIGNQSITAPAYIPVSFAFGGK
jgi:Conserved secreted protein